MSVEHVCTLLSIFKVIYIYIYFFKKVIKRLTSVQNLSGGFPHVIPGGSTLIRMWSFMDAGFGWHAYCSHTEPSSVLTRDLHRSYWPRVEARQRSSSRNTAWRSMAGWEGVWSGSGAG